MGSVTILGGTLAGVASAVRLARLGHTVTLVPDAPSWPDALRATLGTGTLDFPAPWRDLFTKSGRPAAGALGLHGMELVPDRDGPPTDRGEVWYADRERLGTAVADAWRSFVDEADDAWQSVRPLGLEAELTPEAVQRAGLDPRRSLAQSARILPPVLRPRVWDLSTRQGLDPHDCPAWLISRLSVNRTFGRWRLVDAAGEHQPASALVDVLLDRLQDRGVAVAEETRPADAVVDTRDPALVWHRPSRIRRTGSFVDQLLARPGLRREDPTHFHASASSPGGSEPWAQILTGALAVYAVHETLTGQDVRPGNRTAHG